MSNFFKSYTQIILLISIFSIGCQPVEEEEGQIKGNGEIMHLPSFEDGHKICLLGDTGTGESEQFLVAKALEEEACDEIRHLGDIVYERGIKGPNDKNVRGRFLDPYKNLYQRIPFYLAVGNHDYLGDVSAWIEVAQNNPQIVFPSLYYADIHGEVCFVTFDTEGSKTHLAQKIWLENLKNDLADSCELTVAIGHHPYLSVGEHGDASGDEEDFLNNSVVGVFDVYISGHDHNLSDEGSVQGTKFLVSGAGAQLRDLARKPRVWAKSSLGYLTLKLTYTTSGAAFDYSFVEVSSNSLKKVVHQGLIEGKGFHK